MHTTQGLRLLATLMAVVCLFGACHDLPKGVRKEKVIFLGGSIAFAQLDSFVEATDFSYFVFQNVRISERKKRDRFTLGLTAIRANGTPMNAEPILITPSKDTAVGLSSQAVFSTYYIPKDSILVLLNKKTGLLPRREGSLSSFARRPAYYFQGSLHFVPSTDENEAGLDYVGYDVYGDDGSSFNMNPSPPAPPPGSD